MHASSSDHIDQGVDAKQFDLAAHEIGDARLGNAKQLDGLIWSRRNGDGSNRVDVPRPFRRRGFLRFWS
jgi:hypothetical protein